MPTTEPTLNKLALFKSLGYQPHPGQLEIHKSDAPRRIVACGVRWGKTTAAAMPGTSASSRERAVSTAPCTEACSAWRCQPEKGCPSYSILSAYLGMSGTYPAKRVRAIAGVSKDAQRGIVSDYRLIPEAANLLRGNRRSS